jgi:superfamily II DNA or RNA helicase
VIGEGIDVRSTDHLIMCQGGKSEITMVQAIGRAIRLFDGKLMAFIHDFRFEGTNYMIKHVDDRIDAYLRNFQCKVFEHG